MTKENKKLLLQDLAARLPYGVICDMWSDGLRVTEPLSPIGYFQLSEDDISCVPYLRPMSSMTRDEREYMEELSQFKCSLGHAKDKVDFCLRNHLDFRGLIEKGLAFVAPEGCYGEG